LSRIRDQKRGVGLTIGFTEFLQIVNASNYKRPCHSSSG
jgi:hypothetical protein